MQSYLRALSGHRFKLILYYALSLCSSVPSLANDPSGPDAFNPDTIAAVGMIRKGTLLETKEEPDGMVSYVVGIPFKYTVPTCSPIVLQKSSFLKSSELPSDFNPSARDVQVQTSVDWSTVTTQSSQAGKACAKLSNSTQLIKVLIRGKSDQKLIGNILHIPMVPPGKGSEDKRWVKVLVLLSPSKQKVGATILEELPEGYLATYLRLAVLQGKL